MSKKSKETLKRELEKDGIPFPTVGVREDILSDAQAGRVSGVFTVGEKIEHVKEDHEREEVKFRHWMEALTVTASTLEEFRERIKKEANDSRMTIKEKEYGVKYVQRCIDLITKLFKDTDAKRLQSDGAKQALDLTTNMIKRIYDDEREKLRRMEEYLEAPGETAKQRLLNRPTGMNPGRPLEEMQNEIVESKVARKRKSKTKKS